MIRFTAGDRVKYRGRPASVLKVGGGRALIRIDVAPLAKDFGVRWVRLAKLVHDFSRAE